MSKLINNKVWEDYRDNILIDKDNPILAFKANRDRYTDVRSQSQYSGLPQIGSKNSEDALTWNVFRTLSIYNEMSLLERILGPLENPKMLLWALSFSEDSDELQFIVGNTIRSIDGRHMGQITEPDVIIATPTSIFVIECKLGENQKPTHLWEAQRSNKPETEQGPLKREQDYFVLNENPFREGNSKELYKGEGYQLYRMAFYAYQLGKKLDISPHFISLTNQNWWNCGKRSAASIWENFTDNIERQKLEVKNIFWQEIIKCVDERKDPRLNNLTTYLKDHPCLKEE